MKRLGPPSKLSDRELSAMLKSMREDVAAPAAFRGQVLARLAKEGILPPASVPAQPTLLQRLSSLSFPRLGLIAGAACALALVLLNTQAPVPSKQIDPVLSPSTGSGQAPLAVRRNAVKRAAPTASQLETSAVLAQAPAPAAPAAEAAPAPESADLASSEAPALAAGSAPAPSVSQSMGLAASGASVGQAPQFASGGVAGAAASVQAAEVNKPIIIVVNPTPTPLAKPLQGDSEVRNNVVRASRGEHALVIFRVGQPGPVRVSIHDRLGRPVAVLKDASLDAGTYELRWAGASDEGGLAASGIYELRIQAPGYEARHKLMLVK